MLWCQFINVCFLIQTYYRLTRRCKLVKRRLVTMSVPFAANLKEYLQGHINYALSVLQRSDCSAEEKSRLLGQFWSRIPVELITQINKILDSPAKKLKEPPTQVITSHRPRAKTETAIDRKKKSQAANNLSPFKISQVIENIKSQEMPNNAKILLSRELHNCYNRIQEDYANMMFKFNLRHQIQNVLSLRHAGLIDFHLYGSTLTGFSTKDSDADFTVVLFNRHNEIDRELQTDRPNGILILTRIKEILKYERIVKAAEIIYARVPLLKFSHWNTNIVGTIGINCIVGVQNTQLLTLYGQLDWRVQPLIVLIKYWATVNRIKDAFAKTLSSYSLTLMILHFLQSGCGPSVLPCLHEMYPDLDPNNLPRNVNFQSENQMTLAELFVKFLLFYHQFKYQENVVTIRQTSPLSRQEFEKTRDVSPGQRFYEWIAVEEPITKKNVASAVHDVKAFQQILFIIEITLIRLYRSNYQFEALCFR